MCVCACLNPMLPMNKCCIVCNMGAASFPSEQSTWCYWFQRVFQDWQLESLHRSVTALPRKPEKWYSKWERIEDGCHPLKEQWAAARTFIQKGFREKMETLRTNFIARCELRRSSSLLKQGSPDLAASLSLVRKKKTKIQRPTRAFCYPGKVAFES